MKLNPIRSRCSCPECGWFDPVDDFSGLQESHDEHGNVLGIWFDCPRCQAHYSSDDYWELHHGKEQARNHKRAKADLSDEESS